MCRAIQNGNENWPQGVFHLYSDNVRFSRIGIRLICVTDELICSAPNQREICYIVERMIHDVSSYEI